MMIKIDKSRFRRKADDLGASEPPSKWLGVGCFGRSPNLSNMDKKDDGGLGFEVTLSGREEGVSIVKYWPFVGIAADWARI